MKASCPHQVDMVENMCGFVHLTQDEQHLVVDELFVLFEVTAHVLLQLITDLWKHGAILFFPASILKHWNNRTENMFINNKT